ncbi:AAA family ATPase [Devosia sp. MC521]|uniref:AAA family ATPase n=1 Tax=Devosia sp. MC521 TaxID=2759954 RepID=UPI0015FBB36D|nr:AAA family ATPase [Devosia sp. MC521]MBJ6986068.1 hypothetical protein [Devosia sp. MC521]QMW61438.1 hypothetical protein H4N61_10630 [Devosia sp. MC521]
MTSKEQESGSDPRAAIAYADRAALHTRIREGLLPDVDHLLAGAPFFGGDIKRDMQVWCDSWLLGTEILKWQEVLTRIDDGLLLRPIIQNLRDTGSIDAMKCVEYVLRKIDHDDADRMLCYLACSHDSDARTELVTSSRRGAGWEHDEFDRLHVTATAIGMIYSSCPSMAKYCDFGIRIIKSDATALVKYEAARDAAAADAGKADIEKLKKATAAVAQADAELEVLVPEDRAEIVRRPSLERVVVPKLPDVASGHRKDLQKSWKGLDGEALPIVARGDVAAHRRALVAAWPHAADLIDVVLTDLAAREEVRFKPTMFLGPSGAGKSSLARAICDQVGLPSELYSKAGMADSSLGGTSAQWSTARESVPLQLVKRSKMASVAVIWDEVEKADDGKHNGSAMDALLPMLEIHQAKRFRDLTLPEPGWQHLSTLTKQIVDRIARERGVDQRWFAPLAEDEMDLVRAAWPGGSIRQLTRIVTTLIDGRDQLMGRC